MGYLEAYLGKRYSWVSYKNADSEITEFKYGVPQGSPISPFLFNVYCAAALEGCGHGRGLQADDMCVWRAHKQEAVACKELTDDLRTVHEWGVKHNMKFSRKKCKVLRITTKQTRKLDKYPIVLFGGQVLKVVDSHKYLGVVIDKKLTWRKHMKATAERAEKSLRLILRLCDTKRGGKPETAHTLVRVMRSTHPRIRLGGMGGRLQNQRTETHNSTTVFHAPPQIWGGLGGRAHLPPPPRKILGGRAPPKRTVL